MANLNKKHSNRIEEIMRNAGEGHRMYIVYIDHQMVVGECLVCRDAEVTADVTPGGFLDFGASGGYQNPCAGPRR